MKMEERTNYQSINQFTYSIKLLFHGKVHSSVHYASMRVLNFLNDLIHFQCEGIDLVCNRRRKSQLYIANVGVGHNTRATEAISDHTGVLPVNIDTGLQSGTLQSSIACVNIQRKK